MTDSHLQRSNARQSRDRTFRNIIGLLISAALIWAEVLLQTSSDIQMN
jgi:hypothetical protein